MSVQNDLEDGCYLLNASVLWGNVDIFFKQLKFSLKFLNIEIHINKFKLNVNNKKQQEN